MRTNKDIQLYTQNATSRAKLDWLIDRFPQMEMIDFKNGEIDYYGASRLISKALGLKEPLLANASWTHGCYIQGKCILEFLIDPKVQANIRLVIKKEHEEFLQKNGIRNAVAVGAPIIYTPSVSVERVPGSVLFMPGHLSNFSKQDWGDSLSEMRSNLIHLKSKFENVYACVSANCVESGYWIKDFDELGIPWFVGASIFDANALIRMKTIFSSFEYVVTNCIGSHMYQASYFGAKTLFLEPYLVHLADRSKDEPYFKQYPHLLDAFKDVYDYDKVKERYPHLFLDFENVTEQKEWAAQEVGEANKKTPEQMAELFGWDKREVLTKSYFFGVFDSIEQKTSKELLRDARYALLMQDTSTAFDLCVAIRKKGERPQGLDQIRAECFMLKKSYIAAYEALKEELRYYPGNEDAEFLFNQMLRLLPQRQVKLYYQFECDFPELLKLVRPYTMLSEQRLYNLYRMARYVCEQDMPGNFVECGVAAGGSTLLLASVIKKYSKRERYIYSFDTYEGMPVPTEKDISGSGMTAEESGFGTGTCAASIEFVSEACEKLQVKEYAKLVQGLFQDTLPKTKEEIGDISLMHMDGDWYESTMSILDNLYDILLPKAFIQIDDYGDWAGCRDAIHDFEKKSGIQFRLNKIDNTGRWTVRPDSFTINSIVQSNYIKAFERIDPVRHGVDATLTMNEYFQYFYAYVSTTLNDKEPSMDFLLLGDQAADLSVFNIMIAKVLGLKNVSGLSVREDVTQAQQTLYPQLKPQLEFLKSNSSQLISQLNQYYGSKQKSPHIIFVRSMDYCSSGFETLIDTLLGIVRSGSILVFDSVYSEEYLESILTSKDKEILKDLYQIRKTLGNIVTKNVDVDIVESPRLYMDDLGFASAYQSVPMSGAVSQLLFLRKK